MRSPDSQVGVALIPLLPRDFKITVITNTRDFKVTVITNTTSFRDDILLTFQMILKNEGHLMCIPISLI